MEGKETVERSGTSDATSSTESEYHYQVLRYLATFGSWKRVTELALKLSKEEWSNGKLSQHTMAALGRKGSPKLSKVLTSMGIPQNRVEMALAARPQVDASMKPYVECVDVNYLKEQGNSIHFSSCQATRPEARWNGGTDYNGIEGDLPFYTDTLFLWVLGLPMSLSEEGFIARAKLRVMFHGIRCEEPAGLYIDRPYGDEALLMTHLDSLHRWWREYCEDRRWPLTPLLIAPEWRRDDGAGISMEARYGGRYARLWCPSGQGGYQDTLHKGLGPYTFFKEVELRSQDILLESYKRRAMEIKSRFSGEERTYTVHHHPHKATSFNPQAGGLSVPKYHERGWRGSLSPAMQTALAKIFREWGKGLEGAFTWRFFFCDWLEWEYVFVEIEFSFRGTRIFYRSGYHLSDEHGDYFSNEVYYLANLANLDVLLFELQNLGEGPTVVHYDWPEAGFMKAVPLQ